MVEKKSDYVDYQKRSAQLKDLYEVPQTKRTPQVLFDLNKGVFKFAGRSRPYDVNNFYFPLMRKIDHYLDNPCETTYLVFNLDFIDFSSSQFILAIIYRMKKVCKSGNKLRVDWFYKKSNKNMLEVGETYAELSGLDFVFRPIKQ
jgi:hypothetical protein